MDLDEALSHLWNVPDEQQVNIDAWIIAARQQVESDTRRALVSQVWDVYYDAVPACSAPLWLPKGTLQASPALTITTYDEDDAATVLSSSTYNVDTASVPARVWLKSGQSWPTSLRDTNAVVVRATFGYGTPAAVPQALKQALLMLVTQWYAHRGDSTENRTTWLKDPEYPNGYRSLIQPYVIEK